VETTKSYLSIDEFVQQFKFNHRIERSKPENMATWEDYIRAIARLRKESVRYLRIMGMPGQMRSKYNDALQSHAKYGHLEYLYFKDPTCQICYKPIETIAEATIDHIYPRAHGGANHFDNKQIAHGRCNVKKSDKIDVRKL
jgi:5-methylcytosine-specific restriction endonuclease McrA